MDTSQAIKRTLAKTTGVVVFFTFLSRLLSYFTTIIIGARFGASRITDAYLISLIVPELLILLFGAALGFVLTPLFTEYLAKGNEREGWQFIYTNSILVLVFFAFSFIAVFLLSPAFVALLAPGFDIQTRNILTNLIRIVCVYMFFSGLSYIPRSILHSYRRFIIPAASPGLLQIIIIASIFILYRKLYIFSIVIGFAVGALICFLWQIFSLCNKISNFRPYLNWSECRLNVKRLSVLICPLLLYCIVGQTNNSVDRIIASMLPLGSVTALEFAFRVNTIFMPVLAGSFFTVLLPLFSEQVALKDWKGFNETLSFGIRLLNFLLIPVSIVMVFMARPIIEILFQRGAFDARATHLTSSALIAYAVSLAPWACAHIYACGLFAFKDTKSIAKIGFMLILVNLILDLILSRYFAHIGIALGTSIVNILGLWLYINVLCKKISTLNFKDIFMSFGKIVFISLICIFIVISMHNILRVFINSITFIDQLIQMIAVIFVFIVLYIGLCILLRINELKEAFQLLKIR